MLRIATRATLRTEAGKSAIWRRPRAEAADVVTTTRLLSYAKATEIAATLKKFLSSRGDILADDRSNTLIIRDIPATFPVIDNLLRQLDRKSQQVEIEARVVAADRTFSRDIGTKFGIAGRLIASRTQPCSGGGASRSARAPNSRYSAVPADPPVIVGTGAYGGRRQRRVRFL